MKAIIAYKQLKDDNVKCIGIAFTWSLTKLKLSISLINVTLPKDELSYKKIADEIRKIEAV